MKKHFLIGAIALCTSAGSLFAQHILQSQVPSVVVNNFQQAFPKAYDVDWKMDMNLYKVDFELGLLGTDHDVWYDPTGKVVKHKEEISKSDLPQKVQAKINTDFSGFRVSDVKKITEGNNAIYTLDLKTFTQEWKVAYDAEGKILSKVAD